jgi:hypothetical protein
MLPNCPVSIRGGVYPSFLIKSSISLDLDIAVSD